MSRLSACPLAVIAILSLSCVSTAVEAGSVSPVVSVQADFSATTSANGVDSTGTKSVETGFFDVFEYSDTLTHNSVENHDFVENGEPVTVGDWGLDAQMSASLGLDLNLKATVREGAIDVSYPMDVSIEVQVQSQ